MHAISRKMPRNKDGWVDAKTPPNVTHELVWVKNEFGKVSTAWWTGQEWDGRKDKYSDIISWKPLAEALDD